MTGKPPIYVVYVRPQHDRVLAHLCRLGVRQFASFGRSTYPEGLLELFRETGTSIIDLNGVCSDEEKAEIEKLAEERANRIIDILQRRPIVVDDPGAFRVSPETCIEIVKPVNTYIAESELLLRSLDRLSESFDIRAAVVSEDLLQLSRVMVQWIKAHGARSFHIYHGANLGRVSRAYAQTFAEYVLHVGRRGAEPFVGMGHDPRKIVIAGAPGFDVYAELIQRRDAVRREVRAACGLAEDMPMVVFAVTTWEGGTALCEPGIAARTLETFCTAVRYALERGSRFAPIIKDRLDSGQSGQNLVDGISAACGVRPIYMKGRPELLVVAADIVIPCDSNMSLEAIICGVPTLNIWAPLSWIHGPYYGSGDGIPHFRYDKPELLGAEISRILSDAEYRAALVKAQAKALPDIVFEPDGNAALRCASFIVSHSAGSPSATPGRS